MTAGDGSHWVLQAGWGSLAVRGTAPWEQDSWGLPGKAAVLTPGLWGDGGDRQRDGRSYGLLV